MTYQVTHISENGFGSNGEGIPPFRLKSIRDFGTSQRAMASSIRRFFASSFSCSEVSDHRCLNKINRTFLRKRCVTTFRHGDKFGEQKFLSALTELIYVSIKKTCLPIDNEGKKTGHVQVKWIWRSVQIGLLEFKILNQRMRQMHANAWWAWCIQFYILKTTFGK